jgi:hypothetical protein
VDLRRRPEAEREIHEAILRYEAELPGRGRRFFEAVDATAERIRSAPHTFPRLGLGGLRYVVVPNFPYKLIFRVEAEIVWVYAVAHDKRRPGYWRKRIPKG